jgi:hypothetical protein
MELFTTLFGNLLAFVYHCFDRIVIHGYLSALSRPEQVVYFFRQVLGVPVVRKEILSLRTADYQNWVEAFARNHHTPIVWAEKGVRKEDHVLAWRDRRLATRARAVVECSHRPFDHGAFDAPLDGLMMQSERPTYLKKRRVLTISQQYPVRPGSPAPFAIARSISISLHPHPRATIQSPAATPP